MLSSDSIYVHAYMACAYCYTKIHALINKCNKNKWMQVNIKWEFWSYLEIQKTCFDKN